MYKKIIWIVIVVAWSVTAFAAENKSDVTSTCKAKWMQDGQSHSREVTGIAASAHEAADQQLTELQDSADNATVSCVDTSGDERDVWVNFRGKK